jgi:hypothetical protein
MNVSTITESGYHADELFGKSGDTYHTRTPASVFKNANKSNPVPEFPIWEFVSYALISKPENLTVTPP